MDYSDLLGRATCPSPFLAEADFSSTDGYVAGRLCSNLTGISCCLPCPMTDWVYPDNFRSLGTGAEWVSVVGTVCCLFLLLSWLVLPVEKTHRHYLSICLTCAVVLMNLGFVIPLAGQPEECINDITPNGMKSNHVCAAAGAFVILGGWSGVMWVFLRSLSLHLQICWQVVVGRSFMWLSHGLGWGIPVLGTVLALVFSGVSFRFGTTCHVNHDNSLADLWIPLLVFAGLTIVVQFVTFGYCIKVYLASLADNSSTTEGSGLPSYSNSIRTMTPRQAYRRVRRVIQLQWRGIAIVLIIIADVIFFSIVFVFQDNIVAQLARDPARAENWIVCLALKDKDSCLSLASDFAVNQATVGAVLILLTMNGLWLLVLLGRWSMAVGWVDLFTPASRRNLQREFVSVDARLDDLKKDTRSYEMLSRDASTVGRSLNKDNGQSDTGAASVAAGVGAAAAGAGATAAAAAAAPVPGTGPTSPRSPRSPRSTRSTTPVMGLGAIASMGAAEIDSVTFAGTGAASGHRRGGPGHESAGDGGGPHGSYGSHDFGYSATVYAGNGPASGNASASGNTNTPAGHGSIGGNSNSGRRTPDYFGHTARYNAPSRSFSSPRPPATSPSPVGWDARNRSPPPRTYTMRSHESIDDRHPLGMNRL